LRGLRHRKKLAFAPVFPYKHIMVDTDFYAVFDDLLRDGGLSAEFFVRLLMTGAMAGVLLGLRVLLSRMVRRKVEILSPDQRRWITMVKNLVWVLIFLGVVMIWAPQLRTFALSLAAFVVAIVIATKEVILCFTGAFMRVSTAPFRLGDWITIDGISGEVVDINPFAVKVQEIEMVHGTYGFTGKIVQIPNSRYFVAPIENHSYLKQFKPHIFTIAIQDAVLDGSVLLARLREIVTRHVAAHKDEAAQNSRRIARKSGIALPDPAPQILFNGGDFNNLRFTIRAYLPTRSAVAITTAINEEFSALVSGLREQAREHERVRDAAVKAETDAPAPAAVKAPKGEKKK